MSDPGIPSLSSAVGSPTGAPAGSVTSKSDVGDELAGGDTKAGPTQEGNESGSGIGSMSDSSDNGNDSDSGSADSDAEDNNEDDVIAEDTGGGASMQSTAQEEVVGGSSEHKTANDDTDASVVKTGRRDTEISNVSGMSEGLDLEKGVGRENSLDESALNSENGGESDGEDGSDDADEDDADDSDDDSDDGSDDEKGEEQEEGLEDELEDLLQDNVDDDDDDEDEGDINNETNESMLLDPARAERTEAEQAEDRARTKMMMDNLNASFMGSDSLDFAPAKAGLLSTAGNSIPSLHQQLDITGVMDEERPDTQANSSDARIGSPVEKSVGETNAKSTEPSLQAGVIVSDDGTGQDSQSAEIKGSGVIRSETKSIEPLREGTAAYSQTADAKQAPTAMDIDHDEARSTEYDSPVGGEDVKPMGTTTTGDDHKHSPEQPSGSESAQGGTLARTLDGVDSKLNTADHTTKVTPKPTVSDPSSDQPTTEDSKPVQRSEATGATVHTGDVKPTETKGGVEAPGEGTVKETGPQKGTGNRSASAEMSAGDDEVGRQTISQTIPQLSSSQTVQSQDKPEPTTQSARATASGEISPVDVRDNAGTAEGVAGTDSPNVECIGVETTNKADIEGTKPVLTSHTEQGVAMATAGDSSTRGSDDTSRGISANIRTDHQYMSVVSKSPVHASKASELLVGANTQNLEESTATTPGVQDMNKEAPKDPTTNDDIKQHVKMPATVSQIEPSSSVVQKQDTGADNDGSNLNVANTQDAVVQTEGKLSLNTKQPEPESKMQSVTGEPKEGNIAATSAHTSVGSAGVKSAPDSHQSVAMATAERSLGATEKIHGEVSQQNNHVSKQARPVEVQEGSTTKASAPVQPGVVKTETTVAGLTAGDSSEPKHNTNQPNTSSHTPTTVSPQAATSSVIGATKAEEQPMASTQPKATVQPNQVRQRSTDTSSSDATHTHPQSHTQPPQGVKVEAQTAAPSSTPVVTTDSKDQATPQPRAKTPDAEQATTTVIKADDKATVTVKDSDVKAVTEAPVCSDLELGVVGVRQLFETMNAMQRKGLDQSQPEAYKTLLRLLRDRLSHTFNTTNTDWTPTINWEHVRDYQTAVGKVKMDQRAPDLKEKQSRTSQLCEAYKCAQGDTDIPAELLLQVEGVNPGASGMGMAHGNDLSLQHRHPTIPTLVNSSWLDKLVGPSEYSKAGRLAQTQSGTLATENGTQPVPPAPTLPTLTAVELQKHHIKRREFKNNKPKFPISSDTLRKEWLHVVNARIENSMQKIGVEPYDFSSLKDKQTMAEILTVSQESKDKIGPFARALGRKPTLLPSTHRTVPSSIEARSLMLLHYQQQLRGHLLTNTPAENFEDGNIDKNMWRRHKVALNREERTINKLSEDRERLLIKAKKKQKQYKLDTIINHGKAMSDFHSKAQKSTKLIVKAILDYFNSQEKEARIKDEIKERARMRALMEDNEAEYRKLIDEKKDSRLAALLNQTDSYMSTLTDLVQDHQVKERVSRRESEARAAGLTTNKDDIYREEVEATKGGTGGLKQDSYMAVAHKITEPVLTQPKMLENGQLKPYQLKGVEWMVSLFNNNLNGILADEMGLGKTIQTIGLISYLIECKRVNGPYLVAVPLSTMSNWWNEFNKWVPTMKVLRYKGARQERKNLKPQVLQCHYNVLLTTYDFVMKDKATLGKVKWTYLIMDEGHRIKNSDSKLVKVLKNSYHIPHRLLLTGTPLQNSLPELWGLMNFLLPTIFNSGQNFDDWFNEPISATGDKVELTQEESMLIIRRLHKVLRPFLLRRLKIEVVKELPPKRESVIRIPPTPLQKAITRQINRNQMVKLMNDNTIKTTGVTNVLMEMRKVANHPFLVKDCEDNILNQYGNVGDLIWKISGKFELLDRILPKLRATGHRSLLFSQMTKLLDVLGDYLDWKGIKYLRLDGTTKADDRGEMLAQYNSDHSEFEIFLLSTRAGGLGLNLQTADTVLIFDSDWNPHQDLQAQDRAHRIGQKNEVRVLRFVMCNSVEEIMLEAATRKLNMDKRIIQAGRFDQQTTAMERRDILEQVLKSQQHDTDTESESDNEEDDQDEEDVERDEQGNIKKSKWSGNSKSVRYHNWDEINDFLARSEEEKAIYERMDRELQEEEGITRITERFIKKEDIPEVYRKTGAEVQTLLLTKEVEYGRGVREREAISYDENISEKDYFAAADKGISVSEMRERREAKKRRLNTEAAEDEDPFGENSPPQAANPDPFGETPPPPEVEEQEEAPVESTTKSDSESDRPPIQTIKLTQKRDKGKREKSKDKDRPKEKDRERNRSRNKDRSKGKDKSDSKRKRKNNDENVRDSSDHNSGDGADSAAKTYNDGSGYESNDESNRSSRSDRNAPSRKRKQPTPNSESEGDASQEEPYTAKEMGLIINYIRRQDHAQLTEAFEVLPSPQDVPGYYDAVSVPIALKHVQERIDKGYYKSCDGLREDIELLVRNAHSFNDEDSPIYRNASKILKAFHKGCEKVDRKRKRRHKRRRATDDAEAEEPPKISFKFKQPHKQPQDHSDDKHSESEEDRPKPKLSFRFKPPKRKPPSDGEGDF